MAKAFEPLLLYGASIFLGQHGIQVVDNRGFHATGATDEVGDVTIDGHRPTGDPWIVRIPSTLVAAAHRVWRQKLGAGQVVAGLITVAAHNDAVCSTVL